MFSYVRFQEVDELVECPLGRIHVQCPEIELTESIFYIFFGVGGGGGRPIKTRLGKRRHGGVGRNRASECKKGKESRMHRGQPRTDD